MNKSLKTPKLSDKISFHHFGKNEYFIHQTELDHRIKISENVYGLLQKIDGKKSLQDIENKCNNEINTDFLYDLLYVKLGRYGILQDESVKTLPKTKPSYLKLSFIIIPPSFVSKITPYLQFLFRKNVYRVLLPFCLFTISYFIYKNYGLIVNYSFSEKDFFKFLLLAFVSVTFHEFGHVSAAEFFGAKQRGIGGGFYIFTPVYFADVSDIWKIPARQRIIVNMAGVYFELIICTIFVIAGFFIGSDFILLAGTLIFLKTLYNLAPFLRADGYWILTDLLQIPNLWKVSRQTLFLLLKSVFSRKTRFKFSPKNILLSLYASMNYIFLFAFIFYAAFYQIQSIITFPIDLFNYISNLLHGKDILSVKKLSVFIVPFFFYYLVFNYLKIIFKLKRLKNVK